MVWQVAEQLFQIGIKGVVRNEVGEILLLKVPAWSGNPEHWDMPGGRMDPGETFLDTLRRELREEIGVEPVGEPKQLMALLTSITIPVGNTRVPLVFVVYEVVLPEGASITLDPASPELEYSWFAPDEAAKLLRIKCPPEFCELVAGLGLASS